MKILLAEDDFLSRRLLNIYLSDIGEVDIATNGNEAIMAVNLALNENQLYDLICLDIMMPGVDGIEALKNIRTLETQNGLNKGTWSKIIMTTALSEKEYVVKAALARCDAYIIKPVTKTRLFKELRDLGFDIS
jgi:two-component system chemotaxis response regulator CheY